MTYNNGGTRTLTPGEYTLVLSEEDYQDGFIRAGSVQIGIVYTEKGVTVQTQFTVTVEAISAEYTGIELDLGTGEDAVRTEFLEGEVFTCEHLQVYAKKSEGRELLTEGYEVWVDPAHVRDGKLAAGENITVTVRYGAFTATYEITVNAPKPVSLEVTVDPEKAVYAEGDAFDETSLSVSVRYENGSVAQLSEGWEIEEVSTYRLGAQEVVLSYTENGVTVRATVTVYIYPAAPWNGTVLETKEGEIENTSSQGEAEQAAKLTVYLYDVRNGMNTFASYAYAWALVTYADGSHDMDLIEIYHAGEAGSWATSCPAQHTFLLPDTLDGNSALTITVPENGTHREITFGIPADLWKQTFLHWTTEDGLALDTSEVPLEYHVGDALDLKNLKITKWRTDGGWGNKEEKTPESEDITVALYYRASVKEDWRQVSDTEGSFTLENAGLCKVQVNCEIAEWHEWGTTYRTISSDFCVAVLPEDFTADETNTVDFANGNTHDALTMYIIKRESADGVLTVRGYLSERLAAGTLNERVGLYAFTATYDEAADTWTFACDCAQIAEEEGALHVLLNGILHTAAAEDADGEVPAGYTAWQQLMKGE